MRPTPRAPGTELPRFETPLVPRNSIAGRALIAVVAIMTFLVSLTTGAVMLVRRGGERMAIRRRPRGHDPDRPGARGRDVDATVARLPRRRAIFPASPRCGPISKEESTKLLEPWLGSGLDAR